MIKFSIGGNMQSRMDRYNNPDVEKNTRTNRNKKLYDEVKNSSMSEYEMKSSFSIIDDDASKINVDNVRRLLDEHYMDEVPKRKSISIPDYYEDEEIPAMPLADTKEYDINEILAKAKKGKNVDYNKERLLKVRDAQYDILNNLNFDIKEEENTRPRDIEAENTLIDLINTIAETEAKNKISIKETNAALELLDLTDKKPKLEQTIVKKDDEILKEIEKEEKAKENVQVPETKKEEKGEKTEEIQIDYTSYNEFRDVSKRETGSIILKIFVFIVIITLVVGTIYLLNNFLNLGLF